MTETQNLIERIHRIAKSVGKAPSTLSAKVLGGGQVLSDMESGKTITLAKYERCQRLLDEIEQGISA